MKKLSFKIICAAALLLAMPIAGCKGGESNMIVPRDDVTIQERDTTRTTDCKDDDCNDGCNDGKCPEENKDGNDGKGGCKDGKCRLPKGKHRRGFKPVPMPEPIHEEN